MSDVYPLLFIAGTIWFFLVGAFITAHILDNLPNAERRSEYEQETLGLIVMFWPFVLPAWIVFTIVLRPLYYSARWTANLATKSWGKQKENDVRT